MVHKECSINPWTDNTRELWHSNDREKLEFIKVERKNWYYEYPWYTVFEEYDAYGDNGWYYTGCTGDNIVFYNTVQWGFLEGCSKKLSYTAPDNTVYYADIIRKKTDGSCKEDEVEKYWYDNEWHCKYIIFIYKNNI